MFKARQKLGKYKIIRKVARGGFANVYEAMDSVEGIRVALKVPHSATPEMLETFRKEVRLTARLDHPNILPLKAAAHVDGHFIITSPLAKHTLAERLKKRIAVAQALDYTEQILAALAHAHAQHVIHCDVKPENLLLFPNNRLRLTDFGISRVARRTVAASGTGTLGYIAPEQAMGKPSKASDVFSAGLIAYRMLTGQLPEWPFEWPLQGHERLRRLHPDLTEWLRKCLEVDAGRRFRDARPMLAALRRLKPRVLQHRTRRRKQAQRNNVSQSWKNVRVRELKRRYGRALDLKQECTQCSGPVSESMTSCPWCGKLRKVHKGEVSFPAACPRCRRGVKLDWTYCAWCYGAAIGPLSTRSYTDVRYTGRCGHKGCERRELMPFMRYCPWCRRKVKTAWKIEHSKDRCVRCHWGILSEFWNFCPWCARRGPGARRHAP